MRISNTNTPIINYDIMQDYNKILAKIFALALKYIFVGRFENFKMFIISQYTDIDKKSDRYR